MSDFDERTEHPAPAVHVRDASIGSYCSMGKERAWVVEIAVHRSSHFFKDASGRVAAPYLLAAMDMATQLIVACNCVAHRPMTDDYLALIHQIIGSKPSHSAERSSSLSGLVVLRRDRVTGGAAISSACRQLGIGILFRGADAFQAAGAPAKSPAPMAVPKRLSGLGQGMTREAPM